MPELTDSLALSLFYISNSKDIHHLFANLDTADSIVVRSALPTMVVLHPLPRLRIYMRLAFSTITCAGMRSKRREAAISESISTQGVI